MPASPAKVCIHCHQDCSTKPRTKDAQGRYACKACHEKALAALAERQAAQGHQEQAAAIPIADEVPYDDGAMLAGLMDQVVVSEAPAVGAAGSRLCPGCGRNTPAGAVICASCGYNTQTGKRLGEAKVKKGGGGADAAMGALSAAGSLAGAPIAILLCIIGGIIGGGIGAAVWAGISYNTGYEIGWIAWGVGALTGVGVLAAARGHAGTLTGLIAVCIAVGAVLVGKYTAVSMLVDDMIGEGGSKIVFNDDMLKAELARTVATEFESKGTIYAWPQDMNREEAFEPEDFPKPIWTEAMRRWDKMDPERREEWRRDMQDELRTFVAAAVKEEGFLYTFSIFDILWFLLAIGSAYSLGSGAKFDGD
jgi:hypothetical protein